MPQPDEVAQRAQQLIDLFTDAQQRLQAEADEILNDPTRFRRRARLAQLQGSVDDALAGLRTDAAGWLEGNYPSIYAQGAAQGAETIGQPFAWTQFHIEAVQELASATMAEILEATEFVSVETKTWIRAAGRREVAATVIDGQTATQAGRNLARLAARLESPVTSIRYKNGALHSMADYSDTLARTKSALTYNEGTFNQLEQFGVEYVEVFDGAGCHLGPGHTNGPPANGLVLSLTEARGHSLSHPRCRRSWGGRADVTSKEQAKAAKPTNYSPPADAPLPEISPPTLPGRSPRQARTPRSARSAR